MVKYFYKGFEIVYNVEFQEYWVFAPFYHNSVVHSAPFIGLAKQWIENVQSLSEVRRAAASFGHS